VSASTKFKSDELPEIQAICATAEEQNEDRSSEHRQIVFLARIISYAGASLIVIGSPGGKGSFSRNRIGIR